MKLLPMNSVWVCLYACNTRRASDSTPKERNNELYYYAYKLR